MFPAEVHFDQRVSNKMSETAAIKVAVRAGVVLAVVYLRELQTSILMKLLPVEVLMSTIDLDRKNEVTWAMRLRVSEIKVSTLKQRVINMKSKSQVEICITFMYKAYILQLKC